MGATRKNQPRGDSTNRIAVGWFSESAFSCIRSVSKENHQPVSSWCVGKTFPDSVVEKACQTKEYDDKKTTLSAELSRRLARLMSSVIS